MWCQPGGAAVSVPIGSTYDYSRWSEVMSTFPKLKTGAVAQYPADRQIRHSTFVSRFLDNSEQRHREYSGARTGWIIRLSQLTETELSELTNFFIEQQGRLGTFDFEDPWSGSVISGCRFEQDRLPSVSEEEMDSRIELTIIGPQAS